MNRNLTFVSTLFAMLFFMSSCNNNPCKGNSDYERGYQIGSMQKERKNQGMNDWEPNPSVYAYHYNETYGEGSLQCTDCFETGYRDGWASK